MKALFAYFAALMMASPAFAAPADPQIADSKLANSIISVAIEPQLNDGRLVIKIAAKGEDRTLHLRVRLGSDEHGFTIAAPSD